MGVAGCRLTRPGRATTMPSRLVRRRAAMWEVPPMAGMKERMAGKFMQWEGRATGDPVRRAEGMLVAALGRLKQAASKLRRPRRARPTDRGGVR